MIDVNLMVAQKLINQRKDITLMYCEDHEGAFFETEEGDVLIGSVEGELK